jgi:exonuclease III
MTTSEHHIKPQTTTSKQTNNTHTNRKLTTKKALIPTQTLITQYTGKQKNYRHGSTNQTNSGRNENKPRNSANDDNTETLLKQQQRKLIQSEIINDNIGNHLFGDNLPHETQDEIFYFHNINGIKSDDNWSQILLTLREHQVTSFGLAETNTLFAHPATKEQLKKIRQTFKHSRISTTEHTTNTHQYKPGGTLTAVVGKWQSRTTEHGDDERGLGRWSYLKLSSKKKNLVIITAYRPTQSNGINTNWMQQWLLLRKQGIQNPDPITEFYNDLRTLLQRWQRQEYEIVLMIDANETIGTKSRGITEIMVQLNMADLITLHHGIANEPNTHLRGSKRIDYILGTQRVQECCTYSGILPFHNGYASDHRPLFASINLSKLLSDNVTSLDTQATRMISKSTPRERLQLIHIVDEHYQAQNIYARLNTLDQLTEDKWHSALQEEYNACDKQYIIGLLAAERKACRPKNFPWSPAFRDTANLLESNMDGASFTSQNKHSTIRLHSTMDPKHHTMRYYGNAYNRGVQNGASGSTKAT